MTVVVVGAMVSYLAGAAGGGLAREIGVAAGDSGDGVGPARTTQDGSELSRIIGDGRLVVPMELGP